MALQEKSTNPLIGRIERIENSLTQYLPLTGGTINGELFVNGHTKLSGNADINIGLDELYYKNSLEIRESGMVTNTESDFKYAPRIGFHWGGYQGGSLSMDKDGKFFLKKINGVDKGILNADLDGNAATATNNSTYNIPFYKYNWFRTKRDFTNGTNVITDLDGGKTNSSLPFFLHVKGNGYGSGTVNFMCVGYVYQLGNGYSTYYAPNATSHGSSYPSQIKAYRNADGYLCFWWARVAYWQGYNIWVSNEAENQNTFNVYNHVTSVTDIAFPSNAQWTTTISVTAH